ncbi:MAG: helix-turn-helix transcriptional regulator [Selenomonadaceae bacterium]|nr:helix-turn-helix transcriptional regulator [Selenomonadaceae bacterium]
MSIRSFRDISRIRTARLDQGLTCRQLALKCGIKPSTLMEFECGYRPLCANTYRLLLNALNL